MSNIIYVDNAATTPVSKPVFDAMAPYFCEQYGNPSSIFYSVGAAAGDALAAAREKVARALGCDTGEGFFTSCGSEADNWAIKGTAHKFAKQGKKHLITSCIEHHAVLHSMQALEREGFEVTYLPVDAEGFVSPADVEAAIRPDTALVTIMFARSAPSSPSRKSAQYAASTACGSTPTRCRLWVLCPLTAMRCLSIC